VEKEINFGVAEWLTRQASDLRIDIRVASTQFLGKQLFRIQELLNNLKASNTIDLK
jgi:hypothetical protein